MSIQAPVRITSVQPLEGHEGTIVTIKGSGFAPFARSNCVVIGGMGACARGERVTASELTVRIGPVAEETHGDLLMWPASVFAELHTNTVSFGEASLAFSETTLFRNGAPVSAGGIDFKLDKASPNTFGGHLEQLGAARVDLGGYEAGSVMRVGLPKAFSPSKQKTVDICLVLKEPTLALDFTAEIGGRGDDEQCLRAIAKSIVVQAAHTGEQLFADVSRNQGTGGLDLYVKKPYLSNGMVTLHFS